jgi:4-amino-4-deoxy-L-arabinose transferase-like glycosyltransferase
MRPVSDLTLYRYRHLIGYAMLVLATVGLLLLFITRIPNGLSTGEEASALASSQIVFDQNFLDNTHTVDLPYHLVQWTSLKLFGLGAIGVRLPSLIFGALSMLFMLLLLRRWLQENVAISWGILIASSSWFLMLGRSGTPEVMVVFWTSLILLLATLVSQQSRGYQTWRGLSIVAIGLSFYTPLMAYLFAASALAAAFQPHLRYVIRYAEKTSISLGLLLFMAILVPLGWNVWRDPSIIHQLLAIPQALPGPLLFFKDIWSAGGALINPFHASYGSLITPLLSIPMITLATIGLIRTFVDYHSVRSYVLLLWLAVLTPVIGLNPDRLNVMFVPIMLLGAIGMQSLFRYWYDLFPRNPYARIFGLLPLLLLMGSMVSLNYQRYFMGIAYAQSSAVLYNADPLLLHDTLSAKAYRDQRIILITSPERKPLYEIDQAVAKNIQVVTPSHFASNPTANNIIVDISIESQLSGTQRATLPTTTSSLLVNDRKGDSLRFRVYRQ